MNFLVGTDPTKRKKYDESMQCRQCFSRVEPSMQDQGLEYCYRCKCNNRMYPNWYNLAGCLLIIAAIIAGSMYLNTIP